MGSNAARNLNPMPIPSVTLVFTTLPDQDSARQMARLLVEERLAACVNVLSPCQSVYRWQGAMEENEEYPLIIKTRHDLYPRLEHFIRSHHPYELPEIVAVESNQALPEYIDWVHQSAQC